MSAPVEEGALVRLLEGWAPAQRWFPAKGAATRLALRGTTVLAADDDVVVAVHVLAVQGGGHDGVLVQVPLVHRRGQPVVGGVMPGVVGVHRDEDGAQWSVVDGPHDPAYVGALLALLDGGAAGTGAGTARGHLAAGARAPDPAAPSRVLTGEQSNTSVIATPDAGPPVIVKVFRTLAAGDNPDVVVQAALARVGCARIPAPVGWVEGTWPGTGGEAVRGHLAVAAEFMAGAQDAWREALDAVTSGRPFAEEARALGAATGEVHLALAAALPARPAGPEDGAALAQALNSRAAWALRSAPALAGYREALALRLAGAEDLLSGPSDEASPGAQPVLQQVHGDYHLGQVLHAPGGRGWVLLDFEGEPLRPLAERTRPDLALRDVAGMLRSFDYAAATAEQAGGDAGAARRWAQEAREAFCAGYAGPTGHDPRAQQGLLDALELDKALYEVVYETRNRPGWVPVPLSAVRRLLDG